MFIVSKQNRFYDKKMKAAIKKSSRMASSLYSLPSRSTLISNLTRRAGRLFEVVYVLVVLTF